MKKIIVSEFVTLDGVMEDPGGSENFKYGGWTWPYWNDEIGKYKHEELFSSDALLIGRVTYSGFSVAWPNMKDKEGFADRMNSIKKYVVSTSLKKSDWNNSVLINGNIYDEVLKIKKGSGKNILVAGSARLTQTLAQHGLIDEYRILVYPVILGIGKKLFEGQMNRQDLKLVDTRSFGSGVIALHYETLKEIK